MDPQPDPVGRAFTGPAVELALASYPGFTMTTPPQQPTPYGVYRPEYVDRAQVQHTVVHADGRREEIADPTEFSTADPDEGRRPSPYPAPADSLNRRMPLGTFVHARSGDKGGDANIGLWVANDGDPRRRGARHLAGQADEPAPGPRADPRGPRPRGRRLRAAQPRRRSTSSSTACSARAWPRRPGSTRRPRGSASGCARGPCTSRRTCCEVRGRVGRSRWLARHKGCRRTCTSHDELTVGSAGSATSLMNHHRPGPIHERSPRAGRGVRTPRGRAAPPGVGGRRLDPARAAPGRRQAGAARRRLPRGGRRGRRHAARLGRPAGGDVRGGRVQRADGRAVHRRHRAAAHRGVAATPTSSTGSSGRPWPARPSARSRSPSPAAAPTSPASATTAVR